MTEREYRAHPAISHSELLKIAQSPEKFNYYKKNPEPPTPALIFGQLLHAIVLQPDTVLDLFALEPKTDRRTKEGRAEYNAFVEENKGKQIITLDMLEKATAMCDALNHNKFARKLLSGKKETPYFWVDDMTSEPCKCRADCISEIGNNLVIVDLKTTSDASTEEFIKSAVRYGYDVEAAMYREGIAINEGRKPIFVFIAIEKEPPYSINILQADELFIRRGYDVYRELIGIYHDCKLTDNWYGYLGKYNEINNLALPSWLAKTVE